MKTLWLSLCCNDYRNGAFNGTCAAIALPSDELILESPYLNKGLRCEITGNKVSLGKRKPERTENLWTIHAHRSWVGNYCWDNVLLSLENAVALLNFALSKNYRPQEAPVELYEKIERGERLTMGDLLGLER